MGFSRMAVNPASRPQTKPYQGAGGFTSAHAPTNQFSPNTGTQVAPSIGHLKADTYGTTYDTSASMAQWQPFSIDQWMSEMMAGFEESMAAQARAHQDFMAQMSELQKQQLLMQQEQAKAAQVEAGKTASDFPVANAADAARRQMLRRGLMSTFSRNFSARGDKATKLGG